MARAPASLAPNPSWFTPKRSQNLKPMASSPSLQSPNQDTLIQGCIPHQRIHRFKDSLMEGSIFLIRGFDVIASSNRYRLTDHQYMIRFNEQTTMEQVDDTNCSIKVEKFRLRTYHELVKLADKNEDLPDVIGIISNIAKTEAKFGGAAKRVEVHILLEDGFKARVTIWDDLTEVFGEKVAAIKDEGVVIIVTCINPRIYGEKLFLNTASATRFYLNEQFDIVEDFRKRINIEEHLHEIYKGPITDSDVLQESHTISEINEYILAGKEREKTFTCPGKVTEILLRNGWNYISCSKCMRKMTKMQSTLSCNNCNNSKAVGLLRFRLEVVVDDGKDSATFVIFDRDVKKITNTSASDVMTVDDNMIDTSKPDQPVPPCILAIVGRTFKFQVKVTPYNFRTTYQTFTVSRILDDINDEDLRTSETSSLEKTHYSLSGIEAEKDVSVTCCNMLNEVKTEAQSVGANAKRRKKNKEDTLKK